MQYAIVYNNINQVKRLLSCCPSCNISISTRAKRFFKSQTQFNCLIPNPVGKHLCCFACILISLMVCKVDFQHRVQSSNPCQSKKIKNFVPLLLSTKKDRVQRHCCQKKGPADSVRVHCQLDWMRLMQNWFPQHSMRAIKIIHTLLVAHRWLQWRTKCVCKWQNRHKKVYFMEKEGLIFSKRELGQKVHQ